MLHWPSGGSMIVKDPRSEPQETAATAAEAAVDSSMSSARVAKNTRICVRCFAKNFSGETFCKVCGESLPEGTADIEAEATRRFAPPIARARLVVHGAAGREESREVVLDKDVSLVGRGSLFDRVFPDIDLQASDPDNYVSRRHAFIVRRFGGFAIEDLDSVNGTFLNGTHRLPPHALTPLRDGDELIFGQSRCTFRAD